MADQSIYNYSVKDINGANVDLSSFKGKTLLFVNVASYCRFTPQYKELEELYKKYKDEGLVILGFPCNQFKDQEPGTEKDIQQFCSLNYDVSFPLFAKVDVNGSDAHPVFDFLKNSLPGFLGTKAVKWNFTKFLVDKKGHPVKRYAPTENPSNIATDLKDIL